MVDPGRRQARTTARELDLTAVEFELLKLLAQARARVLTPDVLVSALASDAAETIGDSTSTSKWAGCVPNWGRAGAPPAAS